MKKNKKKKLFQVQADNNGIEISRRKYNMLLAGFTLYGFAANIIEYLLFKDVFLSIHPIILIVGYIILGILGCVFANSSKSALGAFLGYNMLVLPLGAVLTNTLYYTLEMSPAAVLYALIGTILITLIMLFMSFFNPNLFLRAGRIVFWIFIAVLFSEFLLWIICGTYMTIFSYIMIAIFGFFIAYDFALANKVRPTVRNAVVFALNLYLDMINIFIDLLEIFSDN